MAEAHMQNLGVYPPLEDPCEDEEGEEAEEEGGQASSAKAAGETETLWPRQRAAAAAAIRGETGCWWEGRGHRPTLKHCRKLNKTVPQIDPIIKK